MPIFFQKPQYACTNSPCISTYRGTPLSWWQGTPCFLLGFSLQWESHFETGKNFLSGKFARCWKWFHYNILMLLGYYSHLLQKRWEFLYPRRHEKARRRRPPFHHCRKKNWTRLSRLPGSFSSAIAEDWLSVFPQLKTLLPPFPWERWKECEVICRKINPNWSSSP